MKCPKCGAEYDECDKYCRACGAKLSSDNEHDKTDTAEQTERAVSAENIEPALIGKGKIFKFSLKTIFAVFIVLSFFIYLLPVEFIFNVYTYVGQGHYTNGLDGNWEESYFLINLIINIFSDVDLLRTPCAVMMLLSIGSAIMILAWIIVSAVKYKKDKYLKAAFKPEVAFIAVYAIFVIASCIAMFEQSRYDMPDKGIAITALLVSSLLCFFVSTVVYIMRKRFFDQHKELIGTLHIV
ncbi:MAG: zinc ribbon domain-containing protein [Clostridiales bacterium]|nr:zinc ribbon domain-containing protein [Clostridiales bacterium]